MHMAELGLVLPWGYVGFLNPQPPERRRRDRSEDFPIGSWHGWGGCDKVAVQLRGELRTKAHRWGTEQVAPEHTAMCQPLPERVRLRVGEPTPAEGLGSDVKHGSAPIKWERPHTAHLAAKSFDAG